MKPDLIPAADLAPMTAYLCIECDKFHPKGTRLFREHFKRNAERYQWPKERIADWVERLLK